MRARTIRDTELDTILEDVRKYSLSDEGREYISADRVTSDEAVLHDRYIRIDDILNRIEDGIQLEYFPSLSSLFSFVKETHRDIDGKDIYRAGEFLHSSFLLFLFEGNEEKITPFLQETEKNILSSLNAEGEVNPEHPRLKPLIRKREETKAERYRYSMSFISSNRQIVQNDNPLYRNERVVIPIFSRDKRGGEYYVSGQSQSGNTTYVEPFELVDLNNRVVLAEEAIRLEKIKILHELSESVRGIIRFLKDMTEYVTQFSFHYAFALWVRKNRAHHIEKGEDIALINAVHPLLGARAVPITVHIPHTTKALVLSGANCGGKSVTMKTVALLSLINQICSFIPASETSTLPYFDSVFTDIGDGQSIENEESTFSSHMSNIAYITKNCTDKSLVILDELGSGTDPSEGSSLSLSVLKYLSSRACLTICTSHYNQVKSYAYTEGNMMNASMEFDTKTSKPTYKVLEGIPGDSHALSTAKRAGMPKEIIEEATRNLSAESNTSTSIITSLLSKSRTLDRKMTELSIEKRALENERKKYEETEKELRGKLLEAEKHGWKELNDYLSSSRKELENLVKAVRTGTLTKEKTKAVKDYIRKVEDKERDVKREIEEKEDEEDTLNTSAFSEGDDVLCGRGKTRGRIVSLRDEKNSVVIFENGLRMTIRNRDMVHAKPVEMTVDVSHFESSAKKAKFVLDVRGLTLQETEKALDDQIEAALLSTLLSFSVIHGYGDGILQKGVQMYLKRNPYVSDYRFALPEDGGMGKTYVTLKKD